MYFFDPMYSLVKFIPLRLWTLFCSTLFCSTHAKCLDYVVQQTYYRSVSKDMKPLLLYRPVFCYSQDWIFQGSQSRHMTYCYYKHVWKIRPATLTNLLLLRRASAEAFFPLRGGNMPFYAVFAFFSLFLFSCNIRNFERNPKNW